MNKERKDEKKAASQVSSRLYYPKKQFFSKIQKNTFLILLLIILFALPSFAEPTFRYVNFTNPLALGSEQKISANITSNSIISLVNIEIANTNYSMTLNNGIYEYLFTPDRGTVSFRIYSKNDQNATSTYSSSFLVKDMISPIITIVSPLGQVITETITLRITTNENSNCKYDTENKTYSLMSNFFTTTGGMTHDIVLTHVPSGDKLYYVSCKDEDDNIAYTTIGFEVNLGPSAQITLSKSSPLKADTYKVNVLTSKPLAQTPTLQYKFDDEQKYYQISLIGQDSSWEGYLVLSTESKDRIGAFSFQGLDYDGLSGTKITSGAMFILDTTKPIAPASVDAVIDDDNVELSWFYDGEEPEEFNIYRSKSSGVEYIDYYDDDKKTPFEDTSVEDEEDYYYRVATVDKAGNIGELSNEVHVFFKADVNEKTTVTVVSPSQKLAPTLEKRLNTTYLSAKTLKFDIKYALSQLEKQTDRFKIIVINELKLIENSKSADLNLDNVLSELDNLRSQDLDESKFDESLKNVEDKIEKIKADFISDVTIIDSIEFTQNSPSEPDIKSAINEIFLRKEVEENIKTNYTKRANTLLDSSTIFETVIIAKLKSLGESEKYVTLVTKEVISSQDVYDVILLESIPKTFSETSKNIIFSQNPVVLKDDPMVYWSYPKLESAKFSYYIYDKKQISDVKDAKTLVLADPVKFLPKKGVYSEETGAGANKLTGNISFNTDGIKKYKEYVFIVLGILVISGLLVYYFFFINDSGFDNEEYDQLEPKTKEYSMQSEANLQNNQNFQSFGQNSYNEETNDEKHIANLLSHAEMHANNLNIGQAVKEYSLIYSFFNSANFDERFKSKVSEKISLLHKKIGVKRKIENASGASKKTDLLMLKKLLLDIKDTNDTFSQDERHPLKDYLKAYHDYYTIMISNIEKDKQNKKL